MEVLNMLNFRNYLKIMLVAVSIVGIPTLSFGMEPDNQTSEVGSYSRRVAGGAKDTVGFVLQKAWDHPYVVVGVGCTVTGLILLRRLVATQADLDAGTKHLTVYRRGQRARVKEVQDAHDADTQGQLTTLDRRQAAVVVVLNATQGNLDYVQVSNEGLLGQLERCGLQSTAFYIGLQSLLKQTSSVANEQAAGLQSMQTDATGISGQLDTTQQRAAVLLGSVRALKPRQERMLATLLQSGEDAEIIERRVQELVANGAQVLLLDAAEDIDQ